MASAAHHHPHRPHEAAPPTTATASLIHHYFCAFDFLSDTPPACLAVVACVFMQHTLAWLWYAWLFRAPWTRALLVDKNVKQLSHIRQRHAMWVAHLSAIVCSIVRTFAVHIFVQFISLRKKGYSATEDATLCLYQQAAVVSFTFMLAGQTHVFWTQRPWAIIGIDVSFELAMFLMAATGLFFLRGL